MPEEGVEFTDTSNLLSFEQITEVVRSAARFGVTKLRITGGEPLVRKNLDELIRMLAGHIGHIDDDEWYSACSAGRGAARSRLEPREY
jgi:cyclic pyranopterin phosphate synthase